MFSFPRLNLACLGRNSTFLVDFLFLGEISSSLECNFIVVSSKDIFPLPRTCFQVPRTFSHMPRSFLTCLDGFTSPVCFISYTGCFIALLANLIYLVMNCISRTSMYTSLGGCTLSLYECLPFLQVLYSLH
jgi:hypothetical protein